MNGETLALTLVTIAFVLGFAVLVNWLLGIRKTRDGDRYRFEYRYEDGNWRVHSK